MNEDEKDDEPKLETAKEAVKDGDDENAAERDNDENKGDGEDDSDRRERDADTRENRLDKSLARSLGCDTIILLMLIVCANSTVSVDSVCV